MTTAPLAPRIPDTMRAVLLTGYGGIDRLVYREDVATPRPEPHEVLERFELARSGWFG